MLNGKTPYYLDVDGVDRICFNKQTAPPLAPLNKGVLYELTDGKLYYNGNVIGGGAISIGDVSGSGSSTINAVPRWDDLTGTVIKDSLLIVSDDGDLTGLQSVSLDAVAANPGGVDTVWLSSVDDRLYKGSSKIGNVSGPGSSTVNSIALFDSVSGDVVKSSFSKVVDSTSTFRLVATGLFDESALWIDRVNGVVSVGYRAGGVGVGTGSTSVGSEALLLGGSLNDNTAVGFLSLASLNSGDGFNTTVGSFAGWFLTSGNRNVILGYNAGTAYTTSESNNIVIGSENTGTVGESNTIRVGSNQTSAYMAGIYNNTTYTGLRQNVMVDQNGKIHTGDAGGAGITGPVSSTVNSIALFDDLTGDVVKSSFSKIVDTATTFRLTNSADTPLLTTNSAIRNVSLGSNALASITTGVDNTATGHTSLTVITTGSQNTAIGSLSLSSLTTGTRCTAVGYNALKFSNGGGNTAVGADALATTSLGTWNTAVGTSALTLNTSNSNTAVGFSSMIASTTSISCDAFGESSLKALTTGNFNSAIGTFALAKLTTGSFNTAVGTAGGNLLTGNNNVLAGRSAGSAYTTSESNNIVIGTSNSGTVGESNTIRIGSTQTSAFMAGIWNNSTHTGDHESVMIDSTGKLHTVPSGTGMAIGEVYFENAVLYTLSLPTLNTAVKIAPTTTLVSNTDFTSLFPGELTFTGMHARYAHIAVSVSLKLNSGSNRTLEFDLRRNAVRIPGSGFRIKLANATDYQSVAFHKALLLQPNDVLSLWITPIIDGSATIDVFNLNIVVVVAH